MSVETISFIVPAYNAEEYIDESIRSILCQTDNEDEVILVDDGSTDKTYVICQRIAEEYSNLKIIHKVNGGVSSARNCGLDIATKKWVFFLDADDKLFDGAVEKLKEHLNDNIQFVVSGYTTSIKNKMRDGAISEVSGNKIQQLLLCYSAHKHYIKKKNRYYGMCLWPCWGKLFRRDTINQNRLRFDTDLFLGEDLLFNLHYIKHIESGLFINEELYYYRLNSASVTGHFQRNRINNTIKLGNKLRDCLGNIPCVKMDYYRFMALRAIICYRDYFVHSDNTDSFEKRKEGFIKFLRNEIIEEAIDRSDYLYLSDGKKQKLEYACILFLLKHKKVDILMKHKF